MFLQKLLSIIYNLVPILIDWLMSQPTTEARLSETVIVLGNLIGSFLDHT